MLNALGVLIVGFECRVVCWILVSHHGNDLIAFDQTLSTEHFGLHADVLATYCQVTSILCAFFFLFLFLILSILVSHSEIDISKTYECYLGCNATK